MENAAFLVSSLEKVFPDRPPTALETPLSLLKNDILSFQLAVFLKAVGMINRKELSVTVESPLSRWVTVRKVELVPSMLPSFEKGNPGMYPDLLKPLENGRCLMRTECWNALWITVETDEQCPAGDWPVAIRLEGEGISLSAEALVSVKDAVLPPQKLIHTEWFHGDCLADYYHLPVFSEAHWEVMEKQIQLAVKRGVNMILTPVFTPPLDTAVGGERTTIQLVDVSLQEGKYAFGFEKFRRWVETCQKAGIQYFEMAHLYTQWGAKHCPKILVETDGEKQKKFGWETDACSPEYREFLEAFLPALIEECKKLGIDKRIVFHISDEPSEADLDCYRKARQQVEDLLRGYPIIDALSDYRFYQSGLCNEPVVGLDHIAPFLEKRKPERFWVYYCCAQWKWVSNRFIALPSSQNRILGVQLYKYQVHGFLHWGFNFYNSQFSRRPINPFAVTDADMGFPSGDAFMVYPGEDGKPWSSIRLEVFYEGLCDLRALALLEELTSREEVLNTIQGGLAEELTVFQYPKDAAYLLKLRSRINDAIACKTNGKEA